MFVLMMVMPSGKKIHSSMRAYTSYKKLEDACIRGVYKKGLGWRAWQLYEDKPPEEFEPGLYEELGLR